LLECLLFDLSGGYILSDTQEKPQRRIEVVYLRPSQIGTNFGNPRKEKKNGAEELQSSLKAYGDFGVLVVDENLDIICGNQRLKEFIRTGDDEPKLCKQLFGYSIAEKRAINIKGNIHAGEWDVDLLADWTADLNGDLGIKESLKKEMDERSIREMELIAYEKYSYVLLATRTELDFNQLARRLGIEDKEVVIARKKDGKHRTIQARAIWYDTIKARILSKEEWDEYQLLMEELTELRKNKSV
jgi:hypothetical protein